MNWKLIFLLSLFGLGMGIATVFVIPSKIEPAFWLVIFLFCAYAIAKRSASWHFVQGLVLGLANSAWITAAHVLLYDRYAEGHAQEIAKMQSAPIAMAPRGLMLVFALPFGLIFGVIIGLLALVAGKVMGKSPVRDSNATA